MTMILAIDPGPTESAYAIVDDRSTPPAFVTGAKATNGDVRSVVRNGGYDVLAIEMIASYGMPVGAETFETCVEIGKLEEIAWANRGAIHCPRRIYRRDVKMAICKSPKANDATIRQALIDMYGGKDKAIGRKASPGPLYRVKADVWSALAVAVTCVELDKGGVR